MIMLILQGHVGTLIDVRGRRGSLDKGSVRLEDLPHVHLLTEVELRLLTTWVHNERIQLI